MKRRNHTTEANNTRKASGKKRAALGISAAVLAAAMSMSAFAAQDPNAGSAWDRTGIGLETQIGQDALLTAAGALEKNALQQTKGGIHQGQAGQQSGGQSRPQIGGQFGAQGGLQFGASGKQFQDAAENAQKGPQEQNGRQFSDGQVDGQRPERPQGFGGLGLNEEGKSILEEMKEAIDALESSSTKTKLNKLISALEEAMEDEASVMEANRPERAEKDDTKTPPVKPANDDKEKIEAETEADAAGGHSQRSDFAAGAGKPDRDSRFTRPEGDQLPPPEKPDGEVSENAKDAGQKETSKPEESEDVKAAREAVKEAIDALEKALAEEGLSFRTEN